MENYGLAGPPVELPREEALVRLYQLQNQLDLEDVVTWSEMPPAGPGFCEDCQNAGELSHYHAVCICEKCGLSRLRVKRMHETRELTR